MDVLPFGLLTMRVYLLHRLTGLSDIIVCPMAHTVNQPERSFYVNLGEEILTACD